MNRNRSRRLRVEHGENPNVIRKGICGGGIGGGGIGGGEAVQGGVTAMNRTRNSKGLDAKTSTRHDDAD